MIAAYLLRRKALRFFIARPQRGRGNLGKAVAISPIVACYPTGYCEIATSACGLLAMTNLETSAVGGVHGNLQLPKALTERRYRRNRLVRFCRQPVRIASGPPGGACPSPTTLHRYSANKQQKQGRTGLGASLFFQLLIPPPAWACRGACTWSSSRRGGCSHSRCSGTGGRRAACAARRPCTPCRSRAARRPS